MPSDCEAASASDGREDCFGSISDPNDTEANFDAINDDSFGDLAIRETAAIERHYWTLGYHESYSKSEESALQEGFEVGYSDAYDFATCLGELLGNYAATVGYDPTIPSHELELPSGNLSSIQSSNAETSDREILIKLSSAVTTVKEILLCITTEPAVVKNAQKTVTHDVSNMHLIQQRRQQTRRKLQEIKQELEDLCGSINKSSKIETVNDEIDVG